MGCVLRKLLSNVLKILVIEEAVYCEGQCKTWLHWQCAGLTVSMFVNITNMDVSTPFLCIYCAFSKQSSEVAQLKNSVNILTQELANIKSSSFNDSMQGEPAF